MGEQDQRRVQHPPIILLLILPTGALSGNFQIFTPSFSAIGDIDSGGFVRWRLQSGRTGGIKPDSFYVTGASTAYLLFMRYAALVGLVRRPLRQLKSLQPGATCSLQSEVSEHRYATSVRVAVGAGYMTSVPYAGCSRHSLPLSCVSYILLSQLKSCLAGGCPRPLRPSRRPIGAV